MKLNSFSPLPEDDDELHLPELVYWASLGNVKQATIGIGYRLKPDR